MELADNRQKQISVGRGALAAAGKSAQVRRCGDRSIELVIESEEMEMGPKSRENRLSENSHGR
eukprot:COSAG01_NODE_19815_length_987_cov_6.959459_1_plen_63_part_00